VLERFCEFSGKSPARLLAVARTPRGRLEILELLERWIESLKGARSTKLNYISTVRGYFAFHGRPLPKSFPVWTRKLRSDRPVAYKFLDKDAFKRMLEACRNDPRTKSMLLVQFQSFSTLRSLLVIGNTMGLKIANELRKGASLVPLHFPYRGRSRYEARVSFIGKDACDSLRDWFSVRGWPDPDNPYIWVRHGGKRGQLTTRDVSNAYSRLAIGLGLRPRKGAGSWVRYGVGSTQVRNLAVACAMLGGADHMIVHALAGHKMDWEALHGWPPDEKSLEQSYRRIEPYLSV
jgi:integrase